jgi:glucosamine-phosphate N-acetyltransferase
MSSTNNIFIIRHLDETDYDNGFLELLGQLTEISQLSETDFRQILYNVQSGYTFVITTEQNIARAEREENKSSLTKQVIVATGCIIIEQKFIHSGGKVGHIEDIVVDTNLRGKGLGKLLIQHLCQVAQDVGCYKVILNCSSDNAKFYEKCGFIQKEVEMSKYF